MAGEIDLKCASCKFNRGGKSCEYENLVKDYATMSYVCKGYVYSDKQLLPKLKDEYDKLRVRYGEIAKELLDKDCKNYDLTKLHLNILENHLIIVEMRIKTLEEK